MPSRWIEFIKDWASKNGISYGCALSNPTMVAEYHKKYNTPKHQERERSRDMEQMGKEMEQMGKEDVRSKAVRTTETRKKVLNPTNLAKQANKLNRMPNGRYEERDKQYLRLIEQEKQRLKDVEDREREKTSQLEAIERQEAIEREKVEQKKVVQLKGKVEIHILDRQGLERAFKRNYNAGDDELYGFPKAPNGNYYDENDWDTLTATGMIMSKNAFGNYKPLAKKLQKMGLLDYDIH
jgi:hypothetical protein